MGRATLLRAVLFLSLLQVVYFIDVRRCARTAFELAASASALPLCTHATHTCPRLTRVIVRTLTASRLVCCRRLRPPLFDALSERLLDVLAAAAAVAVAVAAAAASSLPVPPQPSPLRHRLSRRRRPSRRSSRRPRRRLRHRRSGRRPRRRPRSYRPLRSVGTRSVLSCMRR